MIDLVKRLTVMEQLFGEKPHKFREVFNEYITQPHGLFIYSRNRHFGDHHYGEIRDVGLLFNSQNLTDLPAITLFSTEGSSFYSSQEHLPGLPTLNKPMAVPLEKDDMEYASLANWLLRHVTQSENIPGQYVSMASDAYAQMKPNKAHKRPTAMGS